MLGLGNDPKARVAGQDGLQPGADEGSIILSGMPRSLSLVSEIWISTTMDQLPTAWLRCWQSAPPYANGMTLDVPLFPAAGLLAAAAPKYRGAQRAVSSFGVTWLLLNIAPSSTGTDVRHTAKRGAGLPL